MPAKKTSNDSALEQRLQETIRRLDDARNELESLMAGQVDAVIVPEDGRLLLLRDAEAALVESQARYHRLVTRMTAMVFELTPDGTVQFVNEAVSRLTGYASGELRGRNWWETFCPADARPRCDALQATLQSTDVCNHEMPMHLRDGRELIIELNSANRYDQNGKLLAIVGFGIDITERKQAESQLRLSAAVFKYINEAVLITDQAGHIVAANPSFTDISGFAPHEIIGNELSALRAHDDPEVVAQLWHDIVQSGHWQGEVWHRHKEGDVYPVWLTIGTVKDEQGEVANYVAVFSDISLMKQTEERMTRLAHYDSLTGIPNRLLFTANLDLAVESARRHDKMLALLFLDLDRFKFINDTLGHGTGDKLLQAVALRLKECVRAEDTVARLGGDEFTVILTEIANARDAGTIAGEIIGQIAQPIYLDDNEINTSVSIGISVFPNDANNSTDLTRAADMALYRAKESGRNNYQFFTRELTELARAHHTIEQGLHQAIAQNQFVLHYQPRVALEDGSITGLEALLRWRHPERGLLKPAAFLEVAEDTGLIGEIGEWVLHTACRQALRWQAEGLPPMHISVNISTQQLLHANLIATLQRTLAECAGLQKGLQLDLEITENVLQKVQQNKELLMQVKSLGITLAIDDFGTGYSSLGHLKDLPIDTLKIDRSFIFDIPHHADNNAIAKAIVAMAHSMGIKVIAVGIENIEQFNFLRSLNCEEGQGYFFSKPLPAEAVHNFIANALPHVCFQER